MTDPCRPDPGPRRHVNTVLTMAHGEGDRQAPKSRTLGVRVTEREWRTVNLLADEKGTSVDALLREWGVERLLELAREAGVVSEEV